VNWATNQQGDNQLGVNIWSTGRQTIKFLFCKPCCRFVTLARHTTHAAILLTLWCPGCVLFHVYRPSEGGDGGVVSNQLVLAVSPAAGIVAHFFGGGTNNNRTPIYRSTQTIPAH